MIATAFYDTKPYDRRYFEVAAEARGVHCCFHEFRLSVQTADTATGAQAVCVFVNDRVDRPCLERLRRAG